MKQKSYFLTAALTLAAILLSACGAMATPGAAKISASEVAFTGVIESMDGTQWVVNGQTITVDPSVIKDGPFNVGDTIKIEGVVNADGSLTVTRVEPPTSQDLSTLPQFGQDNSNDANANDANVNDDNANDVNANDDNSNDVNINDDNSNDDDNANINDDNGNGDDSSNANSNGDDDDDHNSNNSGKSGNSNNRGGDDSNDGGNDDNGDDDDD